MPLFDMPAEQLTDYLPTLTAQDDFDSFWQDTLAQANAHDLDAVFEPVTETFATIDAFDTTFSGYAGQRIKGWLLLPKQREDRLPCVVEYIGYGGGRGFVHDWLTYSAYGYAHLVMDTRGQGSRWLHGDTPDNAPEGQNAQHPGFMTRGIQSKTSYYYRRLITDAVRAVDVAKTHPAINPEQIVVAGVSQGGGLAIAVAGLRNDLAGAMPDVPFLCDYNRAIRITHRDPYREIANYLKIHRQPITDVQTVLSYFDGINFAPRAIAPSLFSVGLMDETCPPSTVYGAYNHYNGKDRIIAYEFNDHEGGASHHIHEKIKFLGEIVPFHS